MKFNNELDENEWLPISDLMSVLMMVFIIISVFYMLQVKRDKQKIEEIAVSYNKLQISLYNELKNEFSNDLLVWNAEIDSVKLSIKFLAPKNLNSTSPKIFFKPGSSKIEKFGTEILDDFFPRFLKIIYSEKYRGDIEEIRIEGHTSSEWLKTTLNEDIAYFKNMKLSQDRTRNVLEHVLLKKTDPKEKKWLKKYLTSNGLSSSKLILNIDSTENRTASRRVEFRVKTNAEQSLIEIIK